MAARRAVCEPLLVALSREIATSDQYLFYGKSARHVRTLPLLDARTAEIGIDPYSGAPTEAYDLPNEHRAANK